jgi:hypothetical protein
MSRGRILRVWMPGMHAGMTKLSIFILCRRAQAHETLHGVEITKKLDSASDPAGEKISCRVFAYDVGSRLVLFRTIHLM